MVRALRKEGAWSAIEVMSALPFRCEWLGCHSGEGRRIIKGLKYVSRDPHEMCETSMISPAINFDEPVILLSLKVTQHAA